MPIVHAASRRSFTSISNDLAENPLLSFTARGLALYLLAKPPDWAISIIDLQRRGNCPKAKLRQAIIELEKAGYMVFYRAYEGRGKMRSFWQVYETAVDVGQRSRSYENFAAQWFSSPLKSKDDRSSDVKRRDIVNTHVDNTHETKYSLIREESLKPSLTARAVEVVPSLFSASPLPANSENTDKAPPPVHATGNDSFVASGDSPVSPAIGPGSLFESDLSVNATPAPKTQPRPVSASKVKAVRAPKTPKLPSDPRASHPAIAACRDLVKRFPKDILWDLLIERIGDTPDLDRLKSCFLAHVERGFNPNSWIWATEWYGTGIPQNSVKQKKERNYGNQFAELMASYQPGEGFESVNRS